MSIVVETKELLDYKNEEKLFKSYSKKLLVELFSLADNNDSMAQCVLGIKYRNGESVEKNYDESLLWLKKASENGLLKAKYELAESHYFGYGVEKNYKKAAEMYLELANSNYLPAQCTLGYCYDTGEGVERDLKTAAMWYKKAADLGYAKAQCNIGVCYRYGDGIEKDEAKAFEYFSLAANQHDKVGQFYMAICYENGVGVEINYATAMDYYNKSAKQGHVPSKCNIGYMYEKGHVEKSLEKAIHYYTLAMQQGQTNATYALAICYQEPEFQNYQLAYECAELAASHGAAEAELLLGNFLFWGRGCKPDVPRAIGLYQRALEHGVHYASIMLEKARKSLQ